MPDATALRGTHVLVTGATTPLARGLAVVLAEAGATVSVTTSRDSREEEVLANSILNETWSAGSQGKAETVDLSIALSVEMAVLSLEGEIAPIDALVNVVAVPVDEGASNAALASRAAGNRMVTRGRGRIVNVVPPDASAEARTAIFALSRRLTDEWETRGITVHTLVVEDPTSVEARAALVALIQGEGDPAPSPSVSTVALDDTPTEPPLPPAAPPVVRPPVGTPGPAWGGDGSLKEQAEAEARASRAAATATATPPSAAPVAPVGLPVPAGLELAPFSRRMAAWLIDYVIKFALMLIVLVAAGVQDVSLPLAIPLEILIAVQLLWRGYEALFFMRGQTPGGALLGIRIVRVEDGGEPGIGRALLRTFGAFLSEQAFFIGFAWALRSRLRQGWSDSIASTLVVLAPRKPR